jgi:sugar O-acyltransferase (sialic acid O-acetyltransferase NeuD family)
MRNLAIFGAGGLGREVLDLVRDAPDLGFENVCFVVDDGQVLAPAVSGIPVYSLPRFVSESDPRTTAFVVAVGTPRPRKAIAERLEASGFQTTALIDRRAIVRPSVTVEPGAVVCAGAIINASAIVGRHGLVNCGALVGHDVVLGPYTVLSPATQVLGAVRLAEGVEIGTGAQLYPGIQIGSWARVAMGAAVYRDIPAGQTVAGNPARPVTPAAAAAPGLGG